jgi:hypothetical protein
MNEVLNAVPLMKPCRAFLYTNEDIPIIEGICEQSFKTDLKELLVFDWLKGKGKR